MKRTIRLNESELRRMISESIKKKLNEGVHRYKGFKCVNVSKDPSFPSYEIVSPDGKTIGSTLFPSEMKEIVDSYIKNSQMNETKLRRIVSESVKKLLKEVEEDWYSEEDEYGNTGQPGMVRSYDVGYMTLDRVASEAQEEGMDVVDYLKYWFSEIKSECPWDWQKLGNGYGYHGNTIFYENGVTCKEIFGQIMFDEEEPDSTNPSHDFQKRLSSGEYWMK